MINLIVRLINTHYLPLEVNRSIHNWRGNNCKIYTTFEKDLLGTAGTLIKNLDFNKGDLVRCTDKRGNEIATGLINFNNEEVQAIKGLNSEEISTTLGYLTQEEVIHRNNLVLS